MLAVALFVFALIPFLQVHDFDFINYDDPFYVSQNAHVRHGLTPETIAWAFTSTEGANWFPVTRLSHLLDAQLFGIESGWHHLTSVLIHALTTLLLFAFLHRATAARWPSALVALIFAIHPLHVESVAWVSERKDVLCAFFWMLALWAYVRGRYALLVAAFALGLMSKPMIVTLPLVLLLLDFWPLRRPWALREKLLLFAMAAASAVVTFLVQRASGAVEPFAAVPLALRLENALTSYITYLAKTLWPSDLAVFYPYQADIPTFQWILAAVVLAAVSYAVVRLRSARPYLAVGWFWFLVTLLPVIGLVQVGGQARADRYMYVPMIGLLIAAAWGLASWNRLASKLPATIAAAVAGVGFTAASFAQGAYWQNSETLFRHALAATGRNALAEHQLGNALLEVPGRLPEAIVHLRAAVEINPASANSHNDLGIALARSSQSRPEAVNELREAVRLSPASAGMHANLAAALSEMPDSSAEAIAESRAALQLNPDLAQAHASLGLALVRSGKKDEGVSEMQAAIRLDPHNEDFASNLRAAQTSDYDRAMTLAKTPGKLTEAIALFERELQTHPENAEAHNNLGFALTHDSRRLPEAIKHFEAAIRLNPNYADAHYNLGAALSNTPGRMAEAIRHLEIAERLRPDPELEALLKQLRR